MGHYVVSNSTEEVLLETTAHATALEYAGLLAQEEGARVPILVLRTAETGTSIIATFNSASSFVPNEDASKPPLEDLVAWIRADRDQREREGPKRESVLLHVATLLPMLRAICRERVAEIARVGGDRVTILVGEPSNRLSETHVGARLAAELMVKELREHHKIRAEVQLDSEDQWDEGWTVELSLTF